MADRPLRPRPRIGRRILLILLGLIGAAAVATVAISFHQPPMRLMPAPAAFFDERANVLFARTEENPEPRIGLFYATNREARGTRENREYARRPGDSLNVGTITIRIGDDATTWDRILEWSTRPSEGPRPYLHLEAVDEQAAILADGVQPPDAKAWFAAIDAALANSRDRDIIVYVHGANTNVERAAGQAAQLHHFTGRTSIVLLFAWPTAENFLLYFRDMLTAAQSAPQLARLIELLSQHTAAEHIHVFTYSAGGTVGSMALAIVGRDAEAPGAAPPEWLGEVYHAAPDADFRAFVDDLRHYAGDAERITVAVNMSDSALRLSGKINRGSRAGRPDMRELSPEATASLLSATKTYGLELLRVRPENIPGLSNWSHTFWYDDPWVSSDVLITLLYHLSPKDRGLSEGDTSFGARYWSFTPDHPSRLIRVIDRLRRVEPAAAAKEVRSK
jgi:esterase/lipase superfamily enzyme